MKIIAPVRYPQKGQFVFGNLKFFSLITGLRCPPFGRTNLIICVNPQSVNSLNNRLVGDDGVEPSTSFLSGKRSTAEPIARKLCIFYPKTPNLTNYPIILTFKLN